MGVVLPGRSHPLGATIQGDGVNFSVYTKEHTAVQLLLFDDDHEQPTQIIQLKHDQHRTFHYWHAWVDGIGAGQRYAYRVDGCDKLLLDPYGRGVCSKVYDREAAKRDGDNTERAMKSVVAELRDYDWEGDEPLHHRFDRSVIYEMHVGGFTKSVTSGLPDHLRGTYLGLVEKIPHLIELGVTAVELLPVFQFDAQDAPPGLTNYWGYCPVSFFAPHAGYASDGRPLTAIREFRDMVKALHRADIEVILDVVYNHTAENDHTGPTFCFKGLGDRTYYIKENGTYANFTGTGNTMNGNQSIVRRMILDSLRYWVEEMHVDGFRFDLASILSRDEEGMPIANPPILWDIETDPALAGTKLIAEAWDAAGLYQVGSFIGDHWVEWNGQFRDDVRRFVKGDENMVSKMASRFLASPDIFAHEQREAQQSINFVTCHDGFTMNDLVSYDQKYNLANGEQNRDGADQNHSWNCGREGPTEDLEVASLRQRQIKNFLSITLLSLGVPMLSMGDEVRRSQRGNNNAYCQDNELSWFDWRGVDEHRGLIKFIRGLIDIRQSMPVFRDDQGMSLEEMLEEAPLRWHGVNLGKPDWGTSSRSLAFSYRSERGIFYVILNAYWEPLDFALYKRKTGWRILLDTSKPHPHDIHGFMDAPFHYAAHYRAAARSVVGLFSPA